MQQRLASSSGSRRGLATRPPSLASQASSLQQQQRGAAAIVAAAAAAQRRSCRRRRRRPAPCRASADVEGASSSTSTSTSSDQQPPPPPATQQPQQQQQQRKTKRQADSTDAVASFLTRRFGIAGGLAWAGVLTFGVVSEQLKTRMEQRNEAEATRDASGGSATPLPGLGASYTELRVGGGGRPSRGDLVVLEFSARYAPLPAAGEQGSDGVGGEKEEVTYADPPFADTKATGKPVVLVWGARPLARVIAPAVEAAIADGMRAGSRRVVTIDKGAAGGFGASPPAGVPPGGVALQYDLTLLRVSVAPS